MTHRQVLPPGGQTTNYNINKSTWSTELLMTVRLIYVEVNIYTICNTYFIVLEYISRYCSRLLLNETDQGYIHMTTIKIMSDKD